MVNSTVSTNAYKFEQVHVDWSGLRTQVIIGLLSIFFLCSVNFIPFWQGAFCGLTNGSCIDFTLYFASCSVVALITLAIGATAGNRNGAGTAIWAALLFAASPWQAIICLPEFRFSRTISFLILLSVLLLLLSKQQSGKILAFTSLSLFLCFSFYFEIHRLTVLTSLKELTIAEYMLAASILCTRTLCGAINWLTTITIVLCLVNAVIASDILIYPGLFIVSGAALTITLTLACLPGLGAGPVQTNRLCGSLGLVVLALIAITYELLFLGN